jgi:hypothetical protein
VRAPACALLLAAVLAAIAPTAGGAASVPVSAQIGTEVGVLVGPDGSVADASSVPVRILRERHGDYVVVTIP